MKEVDNGFESSRARWLQDEKAVEREKDQVSGADTPFIRKDHLHFPIKGELHKVRLQLQATNPSIKIPSTPDRLRRKRGEAGEKGSKLQETAGEAVEDALLRRLVVAEKLAVSSSSTHRG